MASQTETVLVVGATGNIGSSVITAALKTGRKVLAIVRNQASAEKMFSHLPVQAKESVTTVEADVTADDGVQSVVAKVEAGELPAFQHVYATVGHMNWTMPLHTVPTDELRNTFLINVDANFFAYRATIPYLLEHGGPAATFTLITGGLGEKGFFGATAVTQGALFSLANCACRELEKTNVRFNEVFLTFRVDFDSNLGSRAHLGYGSIGSSEFSKHYVDVLEKKDVKGCQWRYEKVEDLAAPKWNLKIKS